MNSKVQGFFCDGTRAPGNESEECIFCMLVLQYHIINHFVPGPSGTFSRETVKMYKNPGKFLVENGKISFGEWEYFGCRNIFGGKCLKKGHWKFGVLGNVILQKKALVRCMPPSTPWELTVK